MFFYTADGPTAYMLEAGSIVGAAIGLDSGSSEADFEQAKKKKSWMCRYLAAKPTPAGLHIGVKNLRAPIPMI